MGILDGIVEWVSEQVMNALDLITTSVLGTLGCDMNTFLRFFPAAETMYSIFVATAVGLVLLNWIWQLFKNFGLIAGVEAEDPVKLSIRSVLFIGLIYYCDEITDLVLSIGGTPYDWILTSELPALNFADFNAVLITILTVISNGSIGIIALILLLILQQKLGQQLRINRLAIRLPISVCFLSRLINKEILIPTIIFSLFYFKRFNGF